MALHMEKLSSSQTAKRLQCGKSLVYCAIENFKKHENYDDNKKNFLDSVKRHKEMIMLFNKLSCDDTPLVVVIKYVPIC